MSTSVIDDVINYGFDKITRMLIVSALTIIVAMCLFFVFNKFYYMKKFTPVNPRMSNDDYVTNIVLQTKRDLSLYLNVPIDDVIFISITPKVWMDSSLECVDAMKGSLTKTPLPRKQNGFIVAHKYRSYIYQYNTTSDGQFVLCNKIEIPNNIYSDYVSTSK